MQQIAVKTERSKSHPLKKRNTVSLKESGLAKSVVITLGEPTPVENRKLHLTVSTLAKRTGYSENHLRRLLYAGKVNGTKAGNMWLATVTAVGMYKKPAKSKR